MTLTDVVGERWTTSHRLHYVLTAPRVGVPRRFQKFRLWHISGARDYHDRVGAGHGNPNGVGFAVATKEPAAVIPVPERWVGGRK